MAKKPFVLVHGGWLGGWCWKHVASRLRQAGYDVYTPTLTGLGERKHLRSPDITIDTHINDVVNVIETEELDQVILVGHSYGAMVVSGVADRLGKKVDHLIFFDGALAEDGKSMFDMLPRESRDIMKTYLIDGYLMANPDPANLGVNSDDEVNYKWLSRRFTEHLWRTFDEPISFRNGGIKNHKRTYIYCTDMPFVPGRQELSLMAQADKGMSYVELDACHAGMVTKPDEVAHLFKNTQ